MRTKVSSITLMAGIRMIILTVVLSSLASGAYNPETAVSYAKTWDCDGCRNTDEYLVYDADCANFVSQCLIAGGLDLTACTDPEVVTDEKGCIISCTVLDRYLSWVGVNHDCRLVSEGEPEWLRAGDVIILACCPDRYQHAMIVANGEGANALYSGHSQDQEEGDFSELPKLLWDKYANDYCENTHINYYQIVQGQLVYFADANLKACVEAGLGITDPTPTDMLALTELYCSDRGIADLNGLEYATNLTSLGLKYNQISDISALSGLTNVEELWLGNNQIGDISALSGLTNLERLYIDNNQINDISSLSGLMNLEMLYARNNQVSDISALSGLTNLACVYLYHNQVSDISALSGLTNLNGLYLESNPLDQDAYDIYIPLIRENNPGIYLYYDPPVDHVLTVSKTGSGTIISSPAGINCGSDCSESYEDGTEVTLTGTADDGWVLTDWDFENADITECQLCELAVLRGFDYNISVSCTVTMNRSIDAHITFERGGVIKVTKTGSGTVVSSPGGINCGCDCSEVFMGDSRIVTLTAIPAIGATFLGWEGDCSGTGPCVLDTSRHRNVTANFTQGGQFMLTVSKTGSGTIISSPAGINCGSDCSETYEDGTKVTLTIEADSGWAITDADFSGSCNIIAKQLFQLWLFRPPIPAYYSLPLDIVEAETIAINFSPVSTCDIYVPDDYLTIQEAVDAANSGDTIIIRDGTYTENVDVNKEHLTIRSENGAEVTTVQAANSNDHVFEVTADYVNLSGITVRGAHAIWPDPLTPPPAAMAGIALISSKYSDISNNRVLDNDDGIMLRSSNHNKLSNNIGDIFYLHSSNNNTLTNNDVVISLESSNYNSLSNNTIEIFLWDSKGNIIVDNTISDVIFWFSNNNTLIYNNVGGISFLDCSITAPDGYKYCSNNNLIYLNNLNGISYPCSTNIWSLTEEITYTYDGKTYTSHLGNYWDDYAGSDADGDGIGDTAYVINSDQDNYPLMELFENYEIAGEEPPEMWLKVADTPLGIWRLREKAGLQEEVLMIVPNNWVLKLVTENSHTIDKDGYIWWEVENPGNEITGWMAAQKSDGSQKCLVPGDLEKAEELDNHDARANELLEAIDHYYYSTDVHSSDYSSTSLYKSNDWGTINSGRERNNITYLRDNGFPIELIFAIADVESGDFEYDNKVYGMDTPGDLENGGVGIMQVTWSGNRGWGSNLKYPHLVLTAGEDWYEYQGGYRHRHEYYTNTRQGIYANIKDGLRILQWAYQESRNANPIAHEDIQWIGAVWRYNHGPAPEKGIAANDLYLNRVANRVDPGGSQEIEELCAKMRNYETGEILSPAELRIYDSDGRVTGLVNGEINNGIPDSDYYEGMFLVVAPASSYSYEVVGMEKGKYGLRITSIGDGNEISFAAIDIPTSPNAVHQYSINWDALSVGEGGATLEIDGDGDGVFERTIISDNKLTACKVAIELTGYELISQEQIRETEFDYTFRVLANNSAKQDVKNITFKLVGEPNNTSLIDGIVYFSIIKAGEQILSDDTFKLRSDKSPDVLVRDLVWQICKCIQQSQSDFNRDWNVGLLDLAELTDQWLQSCSEPNWCGGADVDHSSTVDFTDFAIFADNWLWKIIAADFDIDDDVAFDDYAVFAEQWAGQNCAQSGWCDGADLNKNGEVEIFDLAIFVEDWLEGTTP